MTAELYRQLLTISAMWLVVVFVASGAAAWLRWPPASSRLVFSDVVLGLVAVIAAVSMAVGWHRLLLLKEEPAFPYLRLDKIVLAYAGIFIAAQLIGWSLRQAIALSQTIVGHLGAALLATAIGIIVLAVMTRLSLLLPALAAGDTHGVGQTLRRVWTGTRGNTWRLFFGYVGITVLSMLLISPFLFMGHRLGGGQVGYALTAAVSETLQTLLGLLFVTFASLCYWQLFVRDD